jgi:hypothetical protein
LALIIYVDVRRKIGNFFVKNIFVREIENILIPWLLSHEAKLTHLKQGHPEQS